MIHMRRQVHPYHARLLKRRARVRRLRARYFKSGEVDLWKRSIDVETRLNWKIDTNALRWL